MTHNSMLYANHLARNKYLPNRGLGFYIQSYLSRLYFPTYNIRFNWKQIFPHLHFTLIHNLHSCYGQLRWTSLSCTVYILCPILH
jgi:hypothetical protein